MSIKSFCKFCAKSCDDDSSSYPLTDSLIKDFKRKISIELNFELVTNVVCCSSCFSKIKFFVKFLKSIEDAQRKLPTVQQDPLVIDVKLETSELPIINNNNNRESDSNDVEEDLLDEYNREEESADESWAKSKKPSSKKKIKRFHNDFRCAKCKKSHKSYEDLELHILICYQTVEQFSCIVCHKYFETSRGLAIHIASSHRNEINTSPTIELSNKTGITIKRIKR